MNLEGFPAFRIHGHGADARGAVETVTLDDLSPGDLVVRVAWSAVNYKDALAGTGAGRILRRFPLVGGVDAAGTVVASGDSRYRPGDPVVVTGWGLSADHDGGYAGYLRVPASWAVPLPPGLTLRESMVLGTAGLTAALAVDRLEDNGLHPGAGPVLVTGASGGVGSVAVSVLAARGYRVSAVTGKDAEGYLRGLGAAEVIPRGRLELSTRSLDRARWAGVVDPVGGAILAGLLPQVAPGGAVAAVGLTAGTELQITVMPFILRGVALLGIDSVACPLPRRLDLWERLGGAWRPAGLAAMVADTVGLRDLADAFSRVLAGGVRGRILVAVDPSAPGNSL